MQTVSNVNSINYSSTKKSKQKKNVLIQLSSKVLDNALPLISRRIVRRTEFNKNSFNTK